MTVRTKKGMISYIHNFKNRTSYEILTKMQCSNGIGMTIKVQIKKIDVDSKLYQTNSFPLTHLVDIDTDSVTELTKFKQ